MSASSKYFLTCSVDPGPGSPCPQDSVYWEPYNDHFSLSLVDSILESISHSIFKIPSVSEVAYVFIIAATLTVIIHSPSLVSRSFDSFKRGAGI